MGVFTRRPILKRILAFLCHVDKQTEWHYKRKRIIKREKKKLHAPHPAVRYEGRGHCSTTSFFAVRPYMETCFPSAHRPYYYYYPLSPAIVVSDSSNFFPLNSESYEYSPPTSYSIMFYYNVIMYV